MAVARRTVDSFKSDPAMQALANYMAPTLRGHFVAPDICDYIEQNYYSQDEELGEPMPITLMPHQKTILRLFFSFKVNWRMMVYSCPKKSGKALALTTMIPTTKGWVSMGNIKTGDEVFDEQGRVTKVVYVTDPMYGHKCYDVRFSDGMSIIADEDHLWTVQSLMDNYKTQTLSTKEMAAGLYRPSDGARNYRIPVTKPLQLPNIEDLPIDPYVLGAWLGDGTSSNGNITCCDQEILDRISETEDVQERAHTNRAPTYAISPSRHGGTVEEHSFALSTRLKNLGLQNNKFIPQQYLRASYDQRLALLQGLMDTDGYISKARGTSGCECEYTTISMKLGRGIVELLSTLGIKAGIKLGRSTLYGKDCSPRFRIKFHAPDDVTVFHLSRKSDRQRPRTGRTLRSENRHIVSIEEVESVPVKCIQVDSPSQLYLVTLSMIPTHNTALTGAMVRYVAEHFGPRTESLCLANDMEQARGRIYKAVCDSIELDPKFDRSKNTLSNKWKIIQRDATCLKNGSTVRAVSIDHKGEAGSNPVCTAWSELWGYQSEACKKLWAELTPVPTRRRSFRIVETYAGYQDESDILIEVYEKAVKHGRRLTKADLEPYGDWPFDDDPPVYVNEDAGIVAYWDEGEVARRMPWQTPEYYKTERENLTLAQYERLHLNIWTESITQFAPVEWWNRLANPNLDFALSMQNEHNLGTSRGIQPGDRRPLVLGADASVTGDCTALVAFSRHPDPLRHGDLAQVYVRVWKPSRENPMDYTNTIEAEIRRLCAQYNVVELAYDPYQLHKMGTDLSREAVCWARPFSQGIDREKADYQYYTMVRDKAIEHIGDTDAEEHFKNAGSKTAKDEDTKLRIVKRSKDKHIDITVASSMAAAECKRLNL